MIKRRFLLLAILALAAGTLLLAGSSVGQQGGKPASAPAASATPASARQSDDEAARLEGEKRFRANCGRCHQAPHKFPPRTMATIVRHMRVRATLTDEDMRFILRYMTQ